MQKIHLSLLTTLLLASGAVMGDTIDEAFAEGKFTGQFRTFYIDRSYSGVIENNRNSLAVGGHLGYETAPWYDLSLGVRLYSTNFMEIHGNNPRTTDSYDPSLFGSDFESYTFIGELYANYKINNTNIKIGRQKLDTPLAGADDARMLPSLFEAVVISNTDIKDTTLIAAHVTKESVGTFGNAYAPAGPLGLQSGYGLGFANATNGRFRDMGNVALGGDVNTDGVTVAAAIYNGMPGLKLQAWDYYAYDILNAIYLQADYGWNATEALKLNASAQYINESDVGDRLAGNVDSNFWAAKFGASYGDMAAYVAYSQTGSSDNSPATKGGIITPWGGMPAFTQAMATRHQFFAGTDAWKVGASYNFKNLGLPLLASVYYTSFDIGADNTYTNTAFKASESGFDVTYALAKNTEIRLRANYPIDFKPGLDWDEYRVIFNYNF
ncbi:MAG: OprD family outer membrane porin [Sulfurovaceae bacterium]|nr:OprD family outer membrane porin [Sulfurovaceae bacterium]